MSTTTSTSTPAPTLKDRHRAIWAAGDYSSVADRLVLPIGRHVVQRLGLRRECEVLDVATGTGNAAIPAAAAGARVIGLDLVPELLAVARRRGEAAGVDVDWVQGDCEDLPFEDERFDVVMSTLGVQFAPHHEATARELARVTRPGGRMALCNWTPEGYIGQFFATLRPYMPPPPEGTSPPPPWGSEAHVSTLFADTGMNLHFERETTDFEHDSPAAFIDFMASDYGPLVKAREALEPQGKWADLRGDLIGMSTLRNESRDGRFLVASEYLVVLGQKVR